MAATATLNIRLPEDLKRHGGQVLDRAGVSTSDAVRGLYEYMDREQKVPDFIQPVAQDTVAAKRQALRALAGAVKLPEGFDARAEYRQHVLEKSAAGVRA